MLAQSSGAHAGQRAHAFEQSPVEDARRVEIVPDDPRVEAHGQDTVDSESGIGITRDSNALEKEARQHHHHERHSDLRRDKGLPHPASRPRESQLCGLQHRVQIGARGVNRRQQTGDDARYQPNRHREQRDAQIDARVELQRQVARDFNRSDERRARGRDAQTDNGTEDRQDGAFNQELTQQPAPAGAHRQTHRGLAEPRGRRGQQQIRDVDTCNRQHQRGDGEEQPRQAEVVRRFGNPVAGLRVDHCAPSLVGGRILALRDRCETAQVVARLLDRHGRLQPGEDVDRSRRTVGQEIDIRSRGLANHHPRHVQRRLEEWMHAREPLRRDTDDREVDAVEPQRPSDHVAPAAELALPHRVADDDDRTASRCLIVGSGERLQIGGEEEIHSFALERAPDEEEA